MKLSALKSSLLAMSALLLLAGCGGGGSAEIGLDSLKLDAFDTAKAERGAFEVVIEEVGLLEASDTAVVRSPFGAEVKFIEKDGAKVEKGQLLVRLDVEDEEDEFRQKVSELKVARKDMETSIETLERQARDSDLDYERALAGLDFSRSRLVDLNKDLETLEALSALSLVSESEVAGSLSEMDSSKLETYRSDLNFQQSSARGEVDRRIQRGKLKDLEFSNRYGLRRANDLKERVEESEVLAPAAGVWTVARNWSWQAQRKVPVTEGGETRRGWTLGEVALGESFRVRSQVSESKISFVKEGTPARLASTALEGLELEGEVSRVGSAAIERQQSPAGGELETPDFSGLKVFEIEIKLAEGAADKAGGKLSNGMTVDVTIVTDRVEDIASVPVDAVHREEGLPVVFALRPGGRVEKVSVVLGPRNGDRVAIREGLAGDETVFLADLNKEVEKLKAANSGNASAAGA